MKLVFRNAILLLAVIGMIGVLNSSLRADEVPAGRGQRVHRFEYRPRGSPRSVNVAGDFNGWSTTATPMVEQKDGVWAVEAPLSDGVHFYKFVVNGDQWVNDPHSDVELEQPDNYGGKNSAVLIGPDGRKLPPARPNHILAGAVLHDPTQVRDCNVVSPQLLRLAIRTQAEDVSAVRVWVHQDNGQWHARDMGRIDRSFGYDYFATVLQVNQGRAEYMFELKDGPALYVSAGGDFSSMDAAQSSPFAVEMKPAFETPDWAKHAVWYQIFPERFRNGDPSNDPPNTRRWTSSWFARLPGESGKFYEDVWSRRYGGDIQGIRESLPYLRELGVNAIYLNPIFEAEDLHKYDTSDYRHVDDNFGFKGDLEELKGETDDPATWQWSRTDRLFLDFIQEAHRQGFKVIIDGVFNHVGKAHYAFADVLKNGKNSRYADWFEITDFGPPLKYHAWDGPNGALPVFKKDPKLGLARGPREHIMAITKRWLAPDGDASKGVDGFRLDVPGDIPHPFWVDWRKLVKGIKPDAYISGEIWTWAQPWLEGDQFDAVMNYRFATVAQEFFVNQRQAMPPDVFGSRLNQLAYSYPYQVSLVQQNLFDSHDTDRFASMFVNPDLPYDGANRIQDNGPKYSAKKPDAQQWQRMRQAVAFQMAFVGAPMIYYGDEAGMWSPDDPSNRQPMIWRDLGAYDDPQVKFDPAQFKWYQRAIALRQHLMPLQLGYYRTLLADDERGVFAFERGLSDARVYIVLNRSARPHIVKLPVATEDDTAALIDWIGEDQSVVEFSGNQADGRPRIVPRDSGRGFKAANGVLTISLPAYGSAMLSREN